MKSFTRRHRPNVASQSVAATAFLLLLVRTTQISAALAAESSATGFLTPQQRQQQQRHEMESDLITVPLIPHHVQQKRRGLESKSQRGQRTLQADDGNFADQVSALYQGYGTHYVDLWCGTPPQRQTVIVDTGSELTAFPCTGCNDCGAPTYHIDKLFEPEASSSFHQVSCGDDGCNFKGKSKCSTNRATLDQCRVHVRYGEGSAWDAYEAVDRCYLGGPHVSSLQHDKPAHGSQNDQANAIVVDDLNPQRADRMAINLAFGCQTVATRLFKTQLADGIMGMSYGTHGNTYWEQLQRAGRLKHHQRQFSLCFARQPMASKEGTEAGALTLGGADPRLRKDEYQTMVFTDRTANSGRGTFFSVQVRAVYLRESSAGESAVSIHADDPTRGVVKLAVSPTELNAKGIIVDSGTTSTKWNHHLHKEFAEHFETLTGMEYDHGSAYNLTEAQIKAFPTILFQIKGDTTHGLYDGVGKNGAGSADPNNIAGLAGDLDPDHPFDVIVAFPPSHYMEYYEDHDVYVFGFNATGEGGSTIGANMMMGHDVLFDMKHNRIGFAESDCDLSEVLATNGLPSVFDFPPRNPSSPATSIKNELDDNDTSIGDSIDGGTKKDATVNSGSGPSELEIFMKECDNSCKVILVCVGVVIIFLMLCIYRVYCTSSDVRAEYMRANTQEMTPIAPCDPDVEDDIELPQWDGDMDMRNTSGEYRDDPIDEDVPDDELEYADHSDSSASE